MNRVLIVSAVVGLLTAPTVPAQNRVGSGVISGTVVDEGGRLVPRATVRYIKHTAYARDAGGKAQIQELGFSAMVTADPAGQFRITGLPAGTYGVCALASGPLQLGSCDWEAVPATLLGPGDVIRDLTRVVYDGTLLTIRVADPEGRIILSDKMGRSTEYTRRFLVSVSSVSSVPSKPHRMEVVAGAPGQYICRITVPRRTPVRLYIDTDLRVTNNMGAAMETRRWTSQQVLPGGMEQLELQVKVN